MPHGDDSTWVQTFSGRKFWPLDPKAEDVEITDIAHALSLKCRFTGHCRVFYSVADHCLIGAGQADTSESARWFLLHDAAEAYLFDAAGPIKHSLPILNEIEEKIMRCVAERFRLSWPKPDGVKIIDDRMLATERRDLMTGSQRLWPGQAKPYDFKIGGGWKPEVEDKFILEFYKLHTTRGFLPR